MGRREKSGAACWARRIERERERERERGERERGR